MPDQEQKDYFLEAEADRWYERNLDKINGYTASEDKIISLLETYDIPSRSVLEIGCSAGYRLNGIRQRFANVTVEGIDPSVKAIEAGRKLYPSISLHHGTADDLSMFADAAFDVVIMGFVFYVVDRSILLKCVSEADRVLKNGGAMVIFDFYSEAPVRRKYHHITEFEAWSFKQRYDEIFTATHLYQLLHRGTYDHSTMKETTQSQFQEMVSLSLLKKDLDAAYR